MNGNGMENYKWEDFLKETEEIAKNLPNEIRDRLVKISGWAYETEDNLEDKFWFWYSFGAKRISKKDSGLPVDICISQNADYLYRTGKVKVFLDNYEYDKNSVDICIIENGKVYQMEFDKIGFNDEVINGVIRFAYNNRFLLQAEALGYSNRELYIKGSEFVYSELINRQLEEVKKIVKDEDKSNMEKWWDKDSIFKNTLEEEFNYNYFQRMHCLYHKSLRFGQMKVIFSEWFKKKYNCDYFYEDDKTMIVKIDEFFKEIRNSNEQLFNNKKFSVQKFLEDYNKT